MAEDHENKAELREIPASEILDKIQKGEDIEYHEAIIEGDLDLTQLDLHTEPITRTQYQIDFLGLQETAKVVSSKIIIKKSKINGSIIAANVKFDKEVSFEGTKPNKNVDFRGSQFNDDVSFLIAKFGTDKFDIANFGGVQFSNDVNFCGSEFSGAAVFIVAEFSNDADFSDAQFGDYAIFDGARFSGYAEFSESQFSGGAGFNQVQFSDAVNFGGSRFSGDVSFNGSRFSSDAGFSESQFNGNVNFFKSQFSDDADFDGSRFGSDAEFSESQFNGNVRFIKSQFSGDAIFEDVIFTGMLYLTKTKYKRLFIRWVTISKPKYKWKSLANWNRSCNLEFDDTTYLLMIENLKGLGFFEDADNLYYYYRSRRRHTLSAIYRLFDWILWLFYGYGVKPLRPLGGVVILLLAFGLLYSLFGVGGNSTWAVFNTSLIISLSGTKLIEDPNHPTTWMLYWAFTAEKLLASLFFAMFIVSIGRTIIR